LIVGKTNAQVSQVDAEGAMVGGGGRRLGRWSAERIAVFAATRPGDALANWPACAGMSRLRLKHTA
jgi:hypothetical protein